MYRVYYKPRNKFGAKRAEFNGEVYHSKGEAQEAFDLDMQKRAGEITEIRRQVRVSLDVNGYHICNIVVDFWLKWKDGTEEYREFKGFETADWRIKWRLFEALMSGKEGVKLTVVR